MSVGRGDRLELDADESFQHRSWRVQRVGWLVMLLVLAAAGVGLLGSGPLSRTTVTVPEAMRVEHQRFSRFQTPETLRVFLDPEATRVDRVSLGLDRGYLDASKIEAITPPPLRVHGAPDQLIYEFSIARPAEPLVIAFLLQSQQLGLLRGRVVLHTPAGGRPAGFWALVYP